MTPREMAHKAKHEWREIRPMLPQIWLGFIGWIVIFALMWGAVAWADGVIQTALELLK